jgi:hypothetical protein
MRGQRAASRRRALIELLFGVACAAGASWGCNIINPVVAIVTPPPTIEAQYVPENKPLLVVVENFSNPSMNEIDSQRLTYRISEQLEANKVAPIVHPDRLFQLRDAQGDDFRKMSIPQIGNALQAYQVLYVNVREMDVVADTTGLIARSNASLAVRIVESETGRTLWPPDVAEGQPVNVSFDYKIAGKHPSDQRTREPMYGAVSDRIAKLFYKWQQPE